MCTLSGQVTAQLVTDSRYNDQLPIAHWNEINHPQHSLPLSTFDIKYPYVGQNSLTFPRRYIVYFF